MTMRTLHPVVEMRWPRAPLEQVLARVHSDELVVAVMVGDDEASAIGGHGILRAMVRLPDLHKKPKKNPQKNTLYIYRRAEGDLRDHSFV
jgi:hypothetical protein